MSCHHCNDNLVKRHSIFWALHTKWYPSVKKSTKKKLNTTSGRRLYGCQGQNKIGGAHLHHVGSAIHA